MKNPHLTNNNKTDLKFRSYKFSIQIVKFTSTLPNSPVYWVVTDQLPRSATSIGANIVETKAASSKKDFINYCQIALKNANETVYWPSLLHDATNFNPPQVQTLQKEAQELCKILAASLLTMKGKKNIA